MENIIIYLCSAYVSITPAKLSLKKKRIINVHFTCKVSTWENKKIERKL